nr:DUF3238 domain-containing protein [Planococcus glaciei]
MVAKHLEIDLLQQTDTTIYFEWSDTGDTCVVKRDADTIYTGTENSFRDKGLQTGELYTYTIERLGDDGQVKERIKMQTSTEDHSEDTVNYLQQIAITTIVSESKIILAWGAIDGIDEYEIYRDGEPVETTRKTQFTDSDVEMDRDYSYWIRAERPLERSETGFSEEKICCCPYFRLAQHQVVSTRGCDGKVLDCQKIAPLEQLLADAPQVNVSEFKRTWDLRYTTFLPDEYLANPNLLSPNRYFAGDNRTFTPESSHYRTQVNFSLQLGNEETTLEFQKDVGPSIAYDWRKKFRKADVASSEGIQLEKAKEDDRNVMVNLTHSVGNPLTTSPNIDYDVSATFYRDGHYDITGLHDQAPNHEVYLKNDKMDDWFQIHEAESKGLAWMSRSTASQYWRISNFE